MDEILDLAKSQAAGDRERLLSAIVDLCEAEGETRAAAPDVQALLNAVFLRLVVEAESGIRARLSERLAAASWVPPALIRILALDEFEIARPVIAASPLLQDADLIRVLVEATIEHQIEVARRPGLGADVVSTILDGEDPAVMTALADNRAVALGDGDMARLVEHARRAASLRAPLARRPELSAALAAQLHAWVGQALRESLALRFRLDPAFDQALAHAVRDAQAAPPAPPAVVWGADPEQRIMERRLIDKLDRAGQLTPGYLLRALKERKLTLFAAVLARLGGFRPEAVEQALSVDHPELLALACAAIGLDRSVFPTVLSQARQLNGGKPQGDPESERTAMAVFGALAPDEAASAFRRAVTAV